MKDELDSERMWDLGIKALAVVGLLTVLPFVLGLIAGTIKAVIGLAMGLIGAVLAVVLMVLAVIKGLLLLGLALVSGLLSALLGPALLAGGLYVVYRYLTDDGQPPSLTGR